MIDFLKKNYPVIILACVFSFVIIFCLVNLTTKPSLWFDEALNIEAARNLLLFQKIRIQTAPGVFPDVSYTLVTSNYPLIVPLAGFFKIFGFGLFQARIFMLLCILAASAVIYLVVRSLFDSKAAFFAVLFTATFSSFYSNGLTATGEVPGFIFLMLGLFFLMKKENYLLTGLFFGLAVAAKPSIYLLLLPAFFFYALHFRKDFILRLAKFVAGALGPLLVYAFVIVPDSVFSASSWIMLLKFYQNPFVDSPSLTANILENLSRIPFHSTLIYFAFLVFIIIFSFSRNKDLSGVQRKISLFFMVYGFFVFLYFLRSPGWFRYLFPLQILTFIFLFPAFSAIFKKLRQRFACFSFVSADSSALVLCILLALVQVFQLFFISDLRYFNPPRSATVKYQETASFINNHYPNASVGLINLPEIAAFIATDKKYHMIQDIDLIGENPLSLSTELLPALIVVREGRGEVLISSCRDVLEKNYFLVTMIGAYKIFHHL